jgi:putative membrane protein
MSEFLQTHYLWIQSLHIISVIAWMAGMLYLPRLYVYHASAAKGSELSETFKVMERRLLRFIMNPAMIATYLFGVLMIAANPAIMSGGWIHVKLLLVVAMSGVHGFYGICRKKFERDENTHSPKFYRVWNEVPTVMMIAIVILAVVKPF